MINPWQILGIHRASTPDETREAYFALAKKHHPDVGGSVETFTRINQAWNILTMPPYPLSVFIKKMQMSYSECVACRAKGYSLRSKSITAAIRTPCQDCGGAGCIIINGAS